MTPPQSQQSNSKSDSGTDSTQELILREVTRVFEPLEYLTKDSPASVKFQRTRLLLLQIGYSEEQAAKMVDPVQKTFMGMQSAFTVIDDIISLIKNKSLAGVAVQEYPKHVKNIKGLFQSIKKLDDLATSLDVEKLGTRLMDYLVVRYLERYHYAVYTTCRVFNIIEERQDKPTVVHFENVGDVFTEPNKVLVDQFGWGGSEEFDFEFFADIAMSYFEVFDLTLKPTRVSARDAASGEPRVEPSGIQTPVLVNNPKAGGAAFDIGAYWLPLLTSSSDDTRSGVALVPYGKLSFQEDVELGKGWTLKFDAALKENDFLLFADHTGLQVKLPDSPQEALPEGTVAGELENKSESKKGTVVLGNREGTNLHYDRMSLASGVELTDEGTTVHAEADLDAGLKIRPQGGFLKKVLPPDGVNGEFSVTAGWANTRGVYFDGSAKLSTTIPINESIGTKGAKLELIEVYLALEVGGEEAPLRLTGAATASAQLGPISGTVREMGIHGDLKFPESKDGELGPAEFDISFKPPTGVGLSLDSPGISGGGFLGYDPDNERYSAIISLTVGPVQVQVFGLLATEMPDGSDGFSLLLSITATFPPVQLSFGFTLNGLGGVIGINRKLMTKPLRKAARTGSLDNVLFPDNPAANPTQLISDLRSIYPVTEGQHVFGPMARIGWGTPNQIQLDIGIVLQLPKFKIAILGVFRVGLPSIEMPKMAQVMRLNLAVAGSIEPQKNLVAVSASLYDSRIVQFTVKGGMAMRLTWGSDPTFLLSVGGFHPKFEPPDAFPSIDKVVVSLAIPGGNPSVEWKGYFAVTSNTVQVGASFDARFTVGPVSAKGWWSIDALFQFKPFKFVVGLSAGIEVKVKKFTLSITLEGSLKGPSPTHIRGKLSIKLPGPLPNLSPKVHFTIGEEKPSDDALPTADVLSELSTELEKPGNWSAQLPKDGEELVSLREVETDEKTVLAHPMGRLSVRQTTVPLGRLVEKYGENRPIHEEFDVEVGTEDGSLPSLGTTSESFAPEKFEQMSDSEKLAAPSFTDMTAGRKAEGDLLHWGCADEAPSESESDGTSNAASAELIYEPSREEPFPNQNVEKKVPQTDGGDDDEDRPRYPPQVARSLADDGSVANAPRRLTGDGKFRPNGPESDPVELRSNGPEIDRSGMVLADPVIIDTVQYADSGGESS